MTGILEILGIISWNRLSGKPSLCKLLVLWASKSFYFNHSAQHACTHKQISIQRTDRSVKAIFTGIARFMCLFDSLIWWMVVLHTSYVCCVIQQRSPTPNLIPNPLQMKYYTMLSFALSLPPDLFFSAISSYVYNHVLMTFLYGMHTLAFTIVTKMLETYSHAHAG